MSFYHNPVVATVALLSKFETDIRNAESQVTEDLFNSVGKFDFRPDRLSPKVIPNAKCNSANDREWNEILKPC